VDANSPWDSVPRLRSRAFRKHFEVESHSELFKRAVTAILLYNKLAGRGGAATQRGLFFCTLWATLTAPAVGLGVRVLH